MKVSQRPSITYVAALIIGLALVMLGALAAILGWGGAVDASLVYNGATFKTKNPGLAVMAGGILLALVVLRWLPREVTLFKAKERTALDRPEDNAASHALGQGLVDGVHTQLELNDALAESQEWRHHLAAQSELVSKFGGLCDNIRQQGEADREARRAEQAAEMRQESEMFDKFSASVMNAARAKPQFRQVRGGYTPPKAAPMTSLKAWGEPQEQPSKQRKKPEQS